MKKKISLPYGEEFPSYLYRFNDGSNLSVVVMLGKERPLGFFFGELSDIFLHISDYVTHCLVVKNKDDEGKARFDFIFIDKDNYRKTIEGLSRAFNNEYTNYAKLVSGYFRFGVDTPQVCEIIQGLDLPQSFIQSLQSALTRAQEEIEKNKRKKKKKVSVKKNLFG